jgi:predicted TIM-barrel fold metal-dependent hydrolase
MIDCDVHNDWVTAEVLLPFLSPFFRDYLQRGELPGPHGAFPHAHRPFLHPEGARRFDIVASNGGSPGSDYELMRTRLLDEHKIDYAILNGEEAIDVSTLSNPYYASALARAYNDWMIEHWLARDSRLRGSLLVAPQDVQGAMEEIHRLGAHPGIVQVLVSSGSQRPYGDPFYHPIWQAAAEYDLPVAAHLGGQGGINTAPTGVGHPTFYWEAHALLCETAMGHVASLIVHGVFEKIPNFTFVCVELGTAWLPGILWRLDNNYRALRKETPWLKRLPSEYARDHIRLTTQPLERPDNIEQLWHVLEAIDGKNTLLFASDYPHWDFDDPASLKLPPGWRDNVFDANARKVYRRLPPVVTADGRQPTTEAALN